MDKRPSLCPIVEGVEVECSVVWSILVFSKASMHRSHRSSLSLALTLLHAQALSRARERALLHVCIRASATFVTGDSAFAET
jgi:hypothetical protein